MTLSVINVTVGFVASTLYSTQECCTPCAFSSDVEITITQGWPVVPDVASLAAISSSSILNTMARIATAAGWFGDYYWDALSVVADDGFSVIAPTDGGVGRWLKIA